MNGHLHIGGVEKSLISLLKVIDYSQHQVDLLLLEDLGEYVQEIPKEVRLIYYDLKPTYGSVRKVLKEAISSRNYKRFLSKIIITAAKKINADYLKFLPMPDALAKNYDCAIAYRVGMPLDIVGFVIKARVKLVWWHHGEFDYSENQTKAWNIVFRKMNRIVCVSEGSKKMIAQHFPEHKKKMCVIPNIVIPSDIYRDSEEFNPYKDLSQKNILVSIGRMSPEKHMVDTVEVMKSLTENGFHNLIWFLVGDGEEMDSIKDKIREYGLEDYFCLVGNQSNPYPYIKGADVFVHPSRVESQGICVLEAMALNKLCVVVRSMGTDEFVINGYNALKADPSIDSLVKVVEYALKYKDSMDFQNNQLNTVNQFLPDINVPKLFSLITRT